MKGSGLSSTSRTILKKANKRSAFASHQEGYLAAKEKQKSLRLQAEKAQMERQKRVLPQAAVGDHKVGPL